eukprot:gnl/TRDRNA2_/TRDRNA2_80868_c0_seq1.p1 gnl/TRDRNA2_/TRDRNA2_80868_c0~~gnl/TRDRNA2_/TRDRNA2_80868_c0_seq1.p1  ORF type:complete len:556 (-),score=88.57 gnl/TRDRNA2_/TRDRNA2_80868_c0_seq1:95-1762(-)
MGIHHHWLHEWTQCHEPSLWHKAELTACLAPTSIRLGHRRREFSAFEGEDDAGGANDDAEADAGTDAEADVGDAGGDGEASAGALDTENQEKIKSATDTAHAVMQDLIRVDRATDSSRAGLQDLGSELSTTQVRRHAASAAGLTHQTLERSSQLNSALRRFYVARDVLRDDAKAPDLMRPFAERAALAQLAEGAERVRLQLANAVGPARAAIEQLQLVLDHGGAAEATPPLLSAGGSASPAKAPEGQVEAIRTSSGCFCDPASKCGPQGEPFAWCPVHQGAANCPVLEGSEKDPTGLSHDLKLDPGAGAVPSNLSRLGDKPRWDYCVTPAAQAYEDLAHPGALKTVHFNCHCDARDDVLARYERDPRFANSASGLFEAKRVPFSDRLTVEAMLTRRAGQSKSLCITTPSSGGFYVCPVSAACARASAAASVANVGADGGAPSSWFSGLAPRSWDFCVPPPHQAGNMIKGASPSEVAEAETAAQADVKKGEAGPEAAQAEREQEAAAATPTQAAMPLAPLAIAAARCGRRLGVTGTSRVRWLQKCHVRAEALQNFL